MTLYNVPNDTLDPQVEDEVTLKSASEALKTARRSLFKYYDDYDKRFDVSWDLAYYLVTEKTDELWHTNLTLATDNDVSADGWEDYVQNDEMQAQAFVLIKEHLLSYVEATESQQ